MYWRWRSDGGLQTAAVPRLMGARPQSAAAIRARFAEPVRRRLGDHESRRAVRGLATTSRQPSPRPASLRGRQPMEPLRPGQEMFHLRTAFQDGLSFAEKPHGQNTRRSGCEGFRGVRQATAGWNNCCLGRGGALREGRLPAYSQTPRRRPYDPSGDSPQTGRLKSCAPDLADDWKRDPDIQGPNRRATHATARCPTRMEPVGAQPATCVITSQNPLGCCDDWPSPTRPIGS